MPESVRYVLVGLIVCFTAFQEGVTGFGATALALPFVVLLLGLDNVVPALVIQAWILALLIIFECRKLPLWAQREHVSDISAPGLRLSVSCNNVWREYAHIAMLVAVGLPFGMWMRLHIPEPHLKWVLAGFMIMVGIYGLSQQLTGKRRAALSPRIRWLLSVFLPLGGVIHGAFGSGGPLVVVYAARAITDKAAFRLTLCMMWFTMNCVMILQWALSAGNHLHVLRLVGFLLPFTLVGLYIGNRAHYRINEAAFRKLVYSVLVASGLVLVYSLVS